MGSVSFAECGRRESPASPVPCLDTAHHSARPLVTSGTKHWISQPDHATRSIWKPRKFCANRRVTGSMCATHRLTKALALAGAVEQGDELAPRAGVERAAQDESTAPEQPAA